MFMYFYETHQNIQDMLNDNNLAFKMYIKKSNQVIKTHLINYRVKRSLRMTEVMSSARKSHTHSSMERKTNPILPLL